MKIKKVFLTIALLSVSFISCEDLIPTADQTVAGLKEALNVGIKKTVVEVSKPGGYLLNDIIKINLPEDAQSIFTVINALRSQNNFAVNAALAALNIDVNLENTLTVLINGAAEDAAPKSVDVFVSAITGMTISDGKSILFGANDAATQYLKKSTYTQLQSAFEPTITSTLKTFKIAGTTPVQAWEKVATLNNQISNLINTVPGASTILNSVGVSLKPMETNLSDYVTGKALDGLFVKVAGEELKIRKDVSARTSDLLKKVFGELD